MVQPERLAILNGVVSLMRLMNTRLAVSALVATFLAGCASGPYSEDRFDRPSHVDIDDPEKIEQLSYLAQHMMSNRDRKSLLEGLPESQQVSDWSRSNAAAASDAGMTTQMLVDAHQGHVGSLLGTKAGVGVFAASLLLGSGSDGGQEKVGQAFLPGEMFGKALGTEGDVLEALNTLFAQQVEEVASQLSWEMSCEFGCDGSSRNVIYLLSDKNNHPLTDNFHYAPSEFVLQLIVSDIERVVENDPVGAFLPFSPAWKTAGGNTFYVKALSEIEHDKDGGIRLKNVGLTQPVAKRELNFTDVGSSVLSVIHSTPYTFYGNQTRVQNEFFYNGGTYSFYGSDVDLVDRRLNISKLTTK